MLGLRRTYRMESEAEAKWAFGFLETPGGRLEQLSVAYWGIVAAGFLPTLLCSPLIMRWPGAIRFDAAVAPG